MRRSIFLALFFAATLASAQTTRGPQGQVLVPGAGKRPMTFEDMMHMKRLGSTAVSPDGKWLGYTVTAVDLDQNTKTAELWIQPIAGGDPIKSRRPARRRRAPVLRRRQAILFLSSRDHGQQIWLAAFDPATGASSNPEKITEISTEADNASWSPDGKFIVFTSSVYPDCPRHHHRRHQDRRSSAMPIRTPVRPTPRSKRKSSPICSTAIGTTSLATSAAISSSSTSRIRR